MRTKEQIIELIREGKLGVTNNKGETKSVMPLLKNLEARIPSYMDGNDDSSVYYVTCENEVTVIDLKEVSNYGLEVITLQEYLDSPSLSDSTKEIGSYEYDKKLLNDWMEVYFLTPKRITIDDSINRFLNKRYNKDILDQISTKEKEIEELKKQLNTK